MIFNREKRLYHSIKTPLGTHKSILIDFTMLKGVITIRVRIGQMCHTLGIQWVLHAPCGRH